MPYPAIDPRRLQVFPLSQRRNLLRFADEAARPLRPTGPPMPRSTIRSAVWPSGFSPRASGERPSCSPTAPI